MENHCEQKLLHGIKGLTCQHKKEKTATISNIGLGLGQGMVRKGLWEAGKMMTPVLWWYSI